MARAVDGELEKIAKAFDAMKADHAELSIRIGQVELAAHTILTDLPALEARIGEIEKAIAVFDPVGISFVAVPLNGQHRVPQLFAKPFGPGFIGFFRIILDTDKDVDIGPKKDIIFKVRHCLFYRS
jgi:hypothetical protein